MKNFIGVKGMVLTNATGKRNKKDKINMKLDVILINKSPFGDIITEKELIIDTPPSINEEVVAIFQKLTDLLNGGIDDGKSSN